MNEHADLGSLNYKLNFLCFSATLQVSLIHYICLYRAHSIKAPAAYICQPES